MNHLSTGEMLREGVCNNNNRIGCIVKQYMDLGELVPDEVIIEIMSTTIKEDNCIKYGWLLDAFPKQAEKFLKLELKLM